MESHKIKVWVPDDAPDDAHEYVTDAMVSVHGGATGVPARGAWRGPDGDVVKESVTVYETAVDLSEGRARSHACGLAHGVKRRSDETAVMWAVEPMAYGFE